jgi:hypothetical protein
VNLSPHFSLSEFLRSETAARFDIDMSPTLEVAENLTKLCVSVLEPIRAAAGVPIIVTSGYRPRALNELIGGAKQSDHIFGKAADIHAIGMPLAELERVVRRIAPDIPLQKAIVEFGQWLHVSVSTEPTARRQFLVASREGGKTVYREA